jgi:hypothetical protein
VLSHAQGFVADINKLPHCDGVIVYDIQDEEGRDPSIERPYKFAHTMPPKDWAKTLLAQGGVETIVYHGVSNDSPQQFQQWLTQVKDDSLSHSVVLVGKPLML